MANQKPLTEAEKLERAKRQEFGMAVEKKTNEMNSTANDALKVLLKKFDSDMGKKGIEVAFVSITPTNFETIKKGAELKMENARIGTIFTLVISVAPADIPQCGEVAAHRAEVICNTIANVLKED
jgi:hypothetical protein